MSKNKFSKRLAASLIAAATIGSSGVLSSLTYLPVHAADTDNYAKLLQYSMYFYDGNMCGDDVDSASAFDWRGNCHTGDEVVGGFHDAGDHVKFGLPAGYSAATLGWGYYEFKDAYDSLGQTAHLKEITNRFCKYFKDCTVLSGDTVSKFCYQIGEGGGGNDHGYWGPPETQESIKGSRKAFWTSNGASDIAAEYAAALAVNYLNFGNAEDLKYAEALYNFSTQYNQCATEGASGFYSSDTYEDDQAWAAGFLYLATKDDKYKNFMDNFFATGNRQWGEVYTPLGWSNAESGAAALYGEIAGDWKWANSYVSKNCTDKTKFWMPDWASWGSARTNTAMQLVAMVISKHTDNDYSDWCKAQMGMILGDNSTGKNLVVGFNENSPKYPHHRAASGHAYTSSDEATPAWDEANSHVLVGALVGGPSSSDFSTYNDTIKDAQLNEVALDYNAAFVGAAAALYDKYKTGSLDSSIPGVGKTPTTTAATTATTSKTTTTAAVTTTKAAETTKAPTTTAAAQSGGYYSKKVNQDVVYKELPTDDKMLGWSYEDLGVKAGEKVQKVEVLISTTADKIGKWQGAFGSSTTVDPGYWTQTEDMQQVIDGDSGTLVWNVDSATSDIIQTQYGGQVKVGFWWIDCNEFTIDAVRVYTDKTSSNPTTTAAVTTATTKATTKATTTTTKAATTTAAPSTTAAPTTTTELVVGSDPTMAVNKGQKIFVTPEQKYAKIPLNLYNAPDTEGITVAFKTDDEGAATQALLNASSDTYQSYYAVDEFLNLGSWEENPKGLSWGVPSSGTQKVTGSNLVNGDAFFTLFYNIPDEDTVKSIAAANGLELKQDAEHGTYYEFPLVFEKEKLNNKGGKLLDWAGTNNTKVAATYVDSSICIPVTGVEPTTTTAVTTTTPAGSTATTTKTELVVGNDPTMAVNKGEDIVVTPEQKYAKIPLNLYNAPDTEGITVAFKTDDEGAPTQALLNATSDTYQSYYAVDEFLNLGSWEENPKGLSWGVPSSGTQKVTGSNLVNGDAFFTLFYNIPDEDTVKSIAAANGLELKQDAEHGTYYEFPLVFEKEKLNNKGGKLLDWAGTNNTKVAATYVNSNLIVKVTDTQTTTTTGVTTTTATTTTTSSGIKDPTAPRMEVYGEADGEKQNHKIVVTPEQKYAKIPLNLYNVPDTEGITVAFKTDGEGAATQALLNASSDTYQSYYAVDEFLNLGSWEENPKGLSWGVPSSGTQKVTGSNVPDGTAFFTLFYNIPDEATVKSIAEANGLELKHDDEYGAYYEFPLTFEREKLNNKDGKLLDWAGVNNTKIDNAEYVDGSIIVKMTDTTTTTATTGTTTTTSTTTTTIDPTVPRMEVYGEADGEKQNHKIVVTPEQKYAKIPLNLYNTPDTEGITVAFKTDGEGAATQALLNASSDTYQSYYAVDEFLNLGSWEENPKGLSWGVPSSGTQKVTGSNVPDGTAFFTLFYNIPDEATVKSIAEANGLELKHDDEYGAYYEFPLTFEREKLNNKDGKLLDWAGVNNTKVNAVYVDGSLIVKMEDTTTTTTTTTGTTTGTTTTVTTTASDATTTTVDSTTTSGSATTTSAAATTTSGNAGTTTGSTTGTNDAGETSTTTTTKGQLVPLYGDVNVNGQVTIVDVVLLNKAIAGKVDLSEQAFLNADCGNVDQVLDEHDLNALMQYLVGIVQQLPGEAK